MKFEFEDTLYIKGTNEGKISYFPHQDKPFLAVTATESKWYKTLLSAEKFMELRGYEKVEA